MSKNESSQQKQIPITEGKSTITVGDVRGQVPKMVNPPPPPPKKK